MMLAKNSRFWPDRKRPGVELKHLGGPQEDTELRFCVDDSCSYDGQSWGPGTYLPFGADVQTLASEKSATFFVITLPMLADIVAARQCRRPSVGAGARGLTQRPEGQAGPPTRPAAMEAEN
jgi:hypothetical protein